MFEPVYSYRTRNIVSASGGTYLDETTIQASRCKPIRPWSLFKLLLTFIRR